MLLGGNWNNSGDAGPAASNRNNLPSNSDTNIGGRGVVTIVRFVALWSLRLHRPITSVVSSVILLRRNAGSGIAGSRRAETRAQHLAKLEAFQWVKNIGT